MLKIGYGLSSESREPREMAALAAKAERIGFDFICISDHFHPWVPQQGQSAFVWSVLGAISETTERVRVGTAVTCPLIRMHPLIVAQAAATTACQFRGRFFLGVGSGENLNEHVLGDPWPAAETRIEMLEEAIALMRTFWKGETETFRGMYYEVDQARIYTLPDTPPEIYVAASGPLSASVAARCGDGLIGLSPDAEMLQTFTARGGGDKPRLAQLQACVAHDEEEARERAAREWPNAGLQGKLAAELKTPELVAAAVEPLSRDDKVGSTLCGRDAAQHLKTLQQYVDAGYDHVWVNQIGSDQDVFFELYEREILPEARKLTVRTRRGA